MQVEYQQQQAPPAQPTGSATLPPLCDPSEAFAAALSGSGEHLCTRHCAISHQFGNLYRCETSGTVHICDANCNQKIYYDRYSQICRLSRRLFSNADIEMAEQQRKRISETPEGQLDFTMQRKRSSSIA